MTRSRHPQWQSQSGGGGDTTTQLLLEKIRDEDQEQREGTGTLCMTEDPGWQEPMLTEQRPFAPLSLICAA